MWGAPTFVLVREDDVTPGERSAVELSCRQVGATLVLSGELDVASASVAGAALASPDVDTVDMAAVTFIDAAGVGVLLAAHQDPARRRGLRLRRPSRSVRRVLELTELEATFPIVG